MIFQEAAFLTFGLCVLKVDFVFESGAFFLPLVRRASH